MQRNGDLGREAPGVRGSRSGRRRRPPRGQSLIDVRVHAAGLTPEHRVHRATVPVLLAVVVVVAVAVAVVDPGRSAAAGAPGPVAQPRAAVLSPRRVPGLLAAAIADGRLDHALDRVLADPELGDGRTQSCLVVDRGSQRLYARRTNL